MRAEKEEGKSYGPERNKSDRGSAFAIVDQIRERLASRALARGVWLCSKKAVQHEAHPQDEEQHEPRKKSRPH
jgi:hypothetical protein